GPCSLVIFGFPCNQFGFQEPGANADEIRNSLKYVRPGNGFVPNFPLMNKTEVNGINQNPVYTFLKVCMRCPCSDGVIQADRDKVIWSPVRSGDITWNFEKFLIDHHGKPVRRYKPWVHPVELGQDIERLI
ncbi:predicted protein, partial [Nematostella vectensis]